MIHHDPCPWCGSTTTARYYRPQRKPKVGRAGQRLWGWRTARRQVGAPDVKPIRKNKRHFIKPSSGGAGTHYVVEDRSSYKSYGKTWISSTYMKCAHPMHVHDYDEVIPELPIPPRTHHPDLTKDKKLLKRQLQNKDRR